ncbi:RraA family protein [candidate division KSB1 bacterium]|nr:RraA family protein [candidate division KSB1 bacterium]
MRRTLLFTFLSIIITCFIVQAQTAKPEELLKGVNFITTNQYTDAENTEILKLYENLRVADVSDGMDMVGLPNTGLVDPSIHPDWVDTQTLKHVIRGIALTVRYVPTQRPDRPNPDEDFAAWESDFYNTYSSGIYASIIKPGTVLMIDDVEEGDVGTIGSNNILSWVASGAVGVVTDAGARDTDEVAIEKVPLYLRHKSRGIRPGRNELESVNRPICIGGVLVCPGDVVVADGDGVIVVPRKVARQVALYAQKILDNDKQGRRNLYEKLGLPMDQTVK